MGVKRFAMERLGRWLWPTLLGPTVGALIMNTARTLYVGGSWLAWTALALVAVGAGVGLSLTLVLTDWLLLVFRWRTPPTGARAWLSSLSAPVPATLCWSLLRPAWFSSPAQHALAVAAALLLAALSVRLLTSERPGSGRRFGS